MAKDSEEATVVSGESIKYDNNATEEKNEEKTIYMSWMFRNAELKLMIPAQISRTHMAE